MRFRAIVLASALSLVFGPLLTAATFTVTAFTDTAAGTPPGTGTGAAGDLRSAILLANTAGGANTINFSCPSAPCTITLNGPLPPITSSLTLDGGIFGSVIIDGNGAYRAFFVDTGTVVISSLQIQNTLAKGGDGGSAFIACGGGGAGLGGALFVNGITASAAVTVEQTYFLGNSAHGGNGCAISGRSGDGGGGGGLGANGGAGDLSSGGTYTNGAGGGVLGPGAPGSNGASIDGVNGGLGGGGGTDSNGDPADPAGMGAAGYATNTAGQNGNGPSGLGGAGGFGGGGGGGVIQGGAGGFGGGGAGSEDSGGNGGAGGGGGGSNNSGGTGGALATISGGNANRGTFFSNGSSGGGVAAGPDVFVNQGTVTFVDSVSQNPTAVAGTAGTGAQAGGLDATPAFSFAGTVNGASVAGPAAGALPKALTLPATHFQITGPSTVTSGSSTGSNSFTITALDPNGSTVTVYNGTVHMTSSDGSASLPADFTLTNGVATENFSLSTTGSQSLTATDTVISSLTGILDLTVIGAPATKFSVSAPASVTDGVAFSVTVSAQDQNGNATTNYTGTVHFTSTDAAATLPANTILTSGVGTFSATLNTPGNQTITATDTVTASITGTSGTIANNALAPSISAAFSPGSVPAGGTSTTTLTVTVSNPNNAALTGIAFSNTYPSGLVLDQIGVYTCSGSALFPLTSFSFPSATLAANSSCTVSVLLHATQAGSFTDTTSTVTAAHISASGAAASATLTALAAPTLTASFGSPSIASGASTTLSFTAANPNAGTALTGVSFTDTLPAGLAVSIPNGLTGACGTIGASGNLISVSSLTLAASASCTFSVSVTGTSGGTWTDTTSAISSNQGGSGAPATATLQVAQSYVFTPQVSGGFQVTTLPVGGTTTLNITVYNPDNVTLTGIGFTFTFPTTLTIAPSPTSPQCGVPVVVTSSTVAVSGMNLGAGLTCTISVSVAGASVGTASGSAQVVSAQTPITNAQTGSIQITQGAQTITFTAPASLSYPGAPVTLTATASSGLAVSFAVTTGPCTLSGTTLTTTGTGACVVTASQAGNASYAAAPPVSQTISIVAGPSVSSLVDAASFLPAPVAPNSVLSVFGTDLTCSTTPQVLINGAAATVLFASATQINFVVPGAPFSLGTAAITVLCNGAALGSLNAQTALVAPFIFTESGSGKGQGSIVNQDGTVNTAGNPASIGAYISVYVTGFGPLNSPDSDGLQRLTYPVTATIGGAAVPVLYAGQAPGETSGLQQINLQLPPGIPAGPAVPLTLTANGVATQPGVTVSLQITPGP